METSDPDSTPSSEPAAPGQYPCPNCGQWVDISAHAGPAVECPHCQTQFFLPTGDESAEDTQAEEDARETLLRAREEQLSELRIRQAATLRRSAYRTRSFFLIGTFACALAGVLLVVEALTDHHKNHKWNRYQFGELLFAVAAAIGSQKFAKRVAATQREIDADIRARELEEAEAAKHEPDFSTLSDGSQQAENLERMLKKGGNAEKPRDDGA